MSAVQVYARLVAREGLTGQAFYRQDASTRVQHRLATLWRVAQTRQRVACRQSAKDGEV